MMVKVILRAVIIVGWNIICLPFTVLGLLMWFGIGLAGVFKKYWKLSEYVHETVFDNAQLKLNNSALKHWVKTGNFLFY